MIKEITFLSCSYAKEIVSKKTEEGGCYCLHVFRNWKDKDPNDVEVKKFSTEKYALMETETHYILSQTQKMEFEEISEGDLK